MLNYNLNINSPLQQAKKNEDVRPPIYWDFHSFTSASDSTDLEEGSYGFMNIDAVRTNCINVSVDSGNNFTTDAQYPVTASVTGSNFPLTGSTTMSLITFGITYDPASTDQFYSSSFRVSAAQIAVNPSLTGSIITNEFSASEFYRFYVSGSIVHMKGNVYNGPINWLATNQSPSNTTGNVNGFTSSFNIVKDRNVRLVNLQEVTGSTSSSFNNFYALNITSSLTASIINDATGSTTMSINIPEAGISTSSLYFNNTSAGTKITTASFVALNNNPYNITASVIFNKGNQSNLNINWRVSSSSTTQDLQGNTAELNNNSSSFNLKKDIAVLVSYSNISASINGTYLNDYSFNQTASLTSSILPNTTGSVTMSLEIPEIGFSTSSRFFNPISAGIKILSASFEAQTNIPNYNITASVINNKGNESNSNINYLVTGSSAYLASSSLNIRKDANVTMVSESFATPTSGTYKNDYAFNQTASLSSSFEPLYNDDSSSFFIQKLDMKIPEINFTQSLWISSSCGAPYLQLITASFTSETSVSDYNITASIQQYQQSVVKFNITASGAGGGGSLGGGTGGGGGGGMVVSSSAAIQPNVLYEINIGAGGQPGSNGGDTTFIGCNRTINVYAGGGLSSGGSNGGDSGVGYIIENGVTSSTYPAFNGGAGAFESSGFGPRIAGGGGASNTANGFNGTIASGAANGGDGASGETAGGGGGYRGAGPTPPVPGTDGQAGIGAVYLLGRGIGGDGASNSGAGSGRVPTPGTAGILFIRHEGTGSLFTTTNASSSYDSGKNETTYTFFSGSGTLFYQPTATLS
jgi:hypothetical protein